MIFPKKEVTEIRRIMEKKEARRILKIHNKKRRKKLALSIDNC